MNIKDVLLELDPLIDEHWTADGLPRMDPIVATIGDSSVTRKMVTDAIPGFNRDVAYENASAEDEDETEEELEEDEDEEELDESDDPAPTEEVDLETLDVLSMPRDEVLGHPELTSLAIKQLDDRASELLKKKTAIEEEIRQTYAKSEALTRVQTQQRRGAMARGEKRTDVQEYLAGQNRLRAERAARAQRFIDAGTTPGDVASRIGGKSPLDVALGHRRPAPGQRRPEVRKPAHMG